MPTIDKVQYLLDDDFEQEEEVISPRFDKVQYLQPSIESEEEHLTDVLES
jgi:hypothetical protein